MTLDEAIEYYINVATQRAVADEENGVNDNSRWYETTFMTKNASDKIIADNRQLAEWLRELKELRSIMNACNILAVDAFAVEKLCKELKEAKRLLKLAVEGYSFIGHITKNYTCPSFTSCSACPMDEGRQCRVWGLADEALALIGEDGDTNE